MTIQIMIVKILIRNRRVQILTILIETTHMITVEILTDEIMTQIREYKKLQFGKWPHVP